MPKPKPKKETPIIVALIAGAFAIVGPIVTYFVTRSVELSIFNPISEDRRTAMVGIWRGKIEQDFRGKPIEIPADMQIAMQGRTIRGRLHYKFVDKESGTEFEATHEMSGGFLHDRFARLDYKNTKTGVIHFGVLLLELSPSATELTGVASAFGASSQKLVNATLTLSKAN